jgi:membrane associated rhomboid family serine protease
MPPVSLALLIANVAIFFLLQDTMRDTLLTWFALWPPSIQFGPSFEPWQLVTYGFLHVEIVHLLFNMFALYMFGTEVERLFGSRFYLWYYLASVVTAAVTHLVVTGMAGASPAPTIGASGGMFGLLLAFGWYFPQRRVMLLIPPIPMPARVFVTLYGALELVLGVTGSQQGVAHFAHLGGMLGGWLMIELRRRAPRIR